MGKITPIKENANKGFHYTVSDEQIAAHKKRSLIEIFAWLENTSKFIYSLQTASERAKTKGAKNSF